jgi:hypothetical protein
VDVLLPPRVLSRLLVDGAYSVEGKVALILRPNSVENAEQMLTDSGVAVLLLGEIKKYFQ